MDKNRKRAVATVACFTAAIVIWIGANFTVTALTTRTVEPDQQEPQTSRTEPAPSARRAATAQPKASVERFCAATAPAALKAYVTDTADRADQLERYFTQDAAGLDIPIGRIAPQPLDQFTGFIETGDDSADTASCSVATGLASMWTLEYEYTDVNGWLCTSVTGPLEGAYVIQDGAPPDSQRQDSEQEGQTDEIQ